MTHVNKCSRQSADKNGISKSEINFCEKKLNTFRPGPSQWRWLIDFEVVEPEQCLEGRGQHGELHGAVRLLRPEKMQEVITHLKKFN